MELVRVDLPDNKEPWIISVIDRVKIVFEELNRGKNINILLYEHPDTSTFRYRCYNVFQWTQYSDNWRAVYFFQDELEIVKSFLHRIKILTIVRFRWIIELDNIIKQAEALNIPVVYDTDDYIFDLDILPLLTNTIDIRLDQPGEYDHWFSYIARNGFVAKRANIFSCTNDYLGHMLEEKLHHPYYLIRNTLNQEQLDVSRMCIQQKNHSKRKSSFSIGYFSGSPSHNNDFAMIAEEIAYFLEQNRNVTFVIVGFMNLPNSFKAAINRRQVIVFPLVNFLELQTLIASVDINVVPLIENLFTNCKSELKFFEAGIVRTLTIASPIHSYRMIIKDGQNGYLCNSGQWYEKLSCIYKNWEQQVDVINNAYKDSIKYYSGEKIVNEFDKSFDYCISLCNNP